MFSSNIYSTAKENIISSWIPFESKQRSMLCIGNYLPVDENGNPAYLGNIFNMSDREFNKLFKKYNFKQEKAREVLGNLRNLRKDDYVLVKDNGLIVYRVGDWRAYFIKENVEKGTEEFYEIFCVEVHEYKKVPKEKIGKAYDQIIPRKGLQRVVTAKKKVLEALNQE